MKTRSFIFLLCILCAGAGCAGRASGGSVPARQDREHRENAPRESRDECIQSIKRARTDARFGTYRMYVFGRERYDTRFSGFLAEYMQTKYGIELILIGEDNRDRDKCYSNEMDKLLYDRFGADIYSRAEQEARELFDAGR